MNCDDDNEPGGAGCVLPACHDGDHSTVEGATWPRLLERDCPRCGALMYTAPTSPDQICAACQEDDSAELPATSI